MLTNLVENFRKQNTHTHTISMFAIDGIFMRLRLFHSGSYWNRKFLPFFLYRIVVFVLKFNLSIHCSLVGWLVGWSASAVRLTAWRKKKSSRAHVSFFIAFAHWHFALRAFLYILQFFMDESQIKISKNFSRSNEICGFFLKPIINIVKQFVK